MTQVRRSYVPLTVAYCLRNAHCDVVFVTTKAVVREVWNPFFVCISNIQCEKVNGIFVNFQSGYQFHTAYIAEFASGALDYVQVGK